MNLFENAKWIWKRGGSAPNEYVEFQGKFSCEGKEKVTLALSFDSNCNVYVNGELVFFKVCSDYPYYKLYDEIDITKYCGKENDLQIFVWYYGEDNASYYLADAGLIFTLKQGEKELLVSNETVGSRVDARYRNGDTKTITGQLGFSFAFDNAVENNGEFTPSVELEKSKELYKNPLKPLILSGKSACVLLKEGKDYTLVDLGREECGFLSLDIESEEEQKTLITYGEHIVDGEPRRKIGVRDFSVEIKLKKGKNIYRNSFRRLAGRYLQIYHEKPLKIKYLGIEGVYYPTTEKQFALENSLHQKIYDTSVRTLTLSMHEHYEDCPWREQAMYVLDSRNQMLCGYHCFDNAEFARHNLLLMAKGAMPDGLLELTYPAQKTPAIPFFSLSYPTVVEEYIRYTGDSSVLQETSPVLENILSAIEKRVEENGLIANLPYPYWNFYEWSDGSHNDHELARKAGETSPAQYDLMLNCAYVLAVETTARLLGKTVDLRKMKAAIHQNFFDEKKGLYRATLGKELFSELGNAVAILAEIPSKEQATKIADELKYGNQMVKITLSMQCYKYDALLKVDERNEEYVVRDIEKDYSYMLSLGATSFWETMKGESDFDGAGSLCHGWSAMPVYYLQRRFGKK